MITCTVIAADGPVSKLVHPGSDGKLVYAPYNDRGDTIPDFSNCGYGGGGVRVPDVPVRVTLLPAASGDDAPRIQAAIDTVAKLPLDAKGFRGAVLLRKGRYNVGATLQVSASGVVLRGEGQDEKGTVLVATQHTKHNLISISGTTTDITNSPQTITDAYVSVGTHTLSVANGAAFKPGDSVLVVRPSIAGWIHALGMDRIPDKGNTVQWAPGTYDLKFARVITAVNGNRITLDAPLVVSFEKEYGGGFVMQYDDKGNIAHVGIENLRGESVYNSSDDEQHGWNFITINHAQNVWVRNVTAQYFGYSCVTVSDGAKWVTVQDSECLDPMSKTTGGRKYSFGLGGQLCLVQRCRTRGGRHDFVMHARVPGPNVFLDCTAENARSDSGPHHRWATGTLYDNVVVNNNDLNVRDRGNSGSGHGWAGAQMVFWNCTAKRISCQQPPTAQNFAIGCRAEKAPGWHPRPDGWWESLGQRVTPRSLYHQQLEDRLGKSVIANIAPSSTK